MPDSTTLRVRRRGTAMVPNYEVRGRVRRFHGWRHNPKLGASFKDPKTKQAKMAGGFEGHDEVVTVPNTVEYRRHLRDKDLWPADQETAQIAGVPFDPTFGAGRPGPVATRATVAEPTKEH